MLLATLDGSFIIWRDLTSPPLPFSPFSLFFSPLPLSPLLSLLSLLFYFPPSLSFLSPLLSSPSLSNVLALLPFNCRPNSHTPFLDTSITQASLLVTIFLMFQNSFLFQNKPQFFQQQPRIEMAIRLKDPPTNSSQNTEVSGLRQRTE